MGSTSRIIAKGKDVNEKRNSAEVAVIEDLFCMSRVILQKLMFIEVAGYFENKGKSEQNSIFKD